MESTDHTTMPPVTGGRDGSDDQGSTSRFGHLVSAAFAVLGLYVVNNLLDWDILPFLTDDFDRVLPLVNLSLGANLVISLVRFLHPRKWLVLLTELIGTVVGLPAIIRLWQVFPFDFDSGFPWELLVRALLVVAFIGSIIALIVGTVRLLAGLAKGW